MSCNTIKFTGCEIAGTTFEGRTLKVSGVSLDGAKFTAKLRNSYGTASKIIAGVVSGGTVYFSFADYENLKRGTYTIEYWAEIPSIGTEVLAVEKFSIISADGGSGCGCGSEVNANIVFEDVTLDVAINTSVVNIGGGSTDLSGYYTKTQVDAKIPSLAGYATQTWSASQFQAKGNYILKSDFDTLKTTVDSNEGVTQNILTNLGKKADVTYIDNNFQPKGNYALKTDIPDVTGFITTSSATANFAPKIHTHQISEVSGLQNALDGKASTTHTHDSVNNQNGGTLKFWTGTQSEYDAIVTKDGNTLYSIT